MPMRRPYLFEGVGSNEDVGGFQIIYVKQALYSTIIWP